MHWRKYRAGGDDVAPRILGVAEPAQSPRPGLGKPRTLRQIQRSPMFEQTVIDPAQRKENVAARKMAARLDIEPAAALRQSLRRRKIVERRRQFVEDPARRGAAQQRKALLPRVAAGLQRFLIGGQCFTCPTGIEQHVALEQHQRGAADLRCGQRKPALDQRQRLSRAIALEPVLGRQPICVRRCRRPAPIEMRCMQGGVASVEPVGGAGMQRALRFGQQRPQHSLADQRMSEDQLQPLDAQKTGPQQACGVISRNVDQRLQRRQVEPLSQHGGGLNCGPVGG